MPLAIKVLEKTATEHFVTAVERLNRTMAVRAPLRFNSGAVKMIDTLERPGGHRIDMIGT